MTAGQMMLVVAVGIALQLHVVAAAEPRVEADSVELSPSIQLAGAYDWAVWPTGGSDGQPWSRCLDMVWRAVDANSSRLNFVPTHHWLPLDTASNGISAFCTMADTRPRSTTGRAAPAFNANATGTYVCQPWSQALIAEFRDAMALCFTEALRQGLTLYIRPHLDDGLLMGAWRNGLLLQPTTKHDGFSYYDIMLAPLADALREALAISTREGTIKPPPGRTRPTVYFALQGEMSAAIVRYAREWAGVIPALKQRVLAATVAAASDATNISASAAALFPAVDLKIGIGLNFNRLDDTSSPDKRYGSSRLSWLLWQVGATDGANTGPGRASAQGQAPPIDVAGLRALFTSTLDFVGISAYAPYNLQDGVLTADQFGNSADMFATELQELVGIDLRRLLAPAGRLELHYSEFGIGGGASYGGTQVAQGPSDVALRPFFGIYGPYDASRDPWSVPANAAFRRQFYSLAMAWLANPNNKEYRLSGVFVWSMASWDVFGVHPESYAGPAGATAGGSYRDAAVVAAAARYNRAVREAAIAAAATSLEPALAADEEGVAAGTVAASGR